MPARISPTMGEIFTQPARRPATSTALRNTMRLYSSVHKLGILTRVALALLSFPRFFRHFFELSVYSSDTEYDFNILSVTIIREMSFPTGLFWHRTRPQAWKGKQNAAKKWPFALSHARMLGSGSPAEQRSGSKSTSSFFSFPKLSLFGDSEAKAVEAAPPSSAPMKRSRPEVRPCRLSTAPCIFWSLRRAPL
eukprot:scaffold331_cov243-Pinguiococcus_pyrenoidosus.AAC.8